MASMVPSERQTHQGTTSNIKKASRTYDGLGRSFAQDTGNGTGATLFSVRSPEPGRPFQHKHQAPHTPSPPHTLNVLRRNTSTYQFLSRHPQHTLFLYSLRLTFLRPETPTARARPARSTLPTRSPSTRPARLRSSLRESVVTIESSPVMVVRPSPSSTRRPRPPRRSSFVWSARSASTSTRSP